MTLSISGNNTLIFFRDTRCTVRCVLAFVGFHRLVLNLANSFPKPATITDVSLFFSTTVAVNLLASEVQLKAKIFVSSTPDNVFTQLGPDLPIGAVLTGNVIVGSIRNDVIHGLSLALAEQSRVVLVVSSTANGVISTVTGYVSAGIMVFL